ncbi:MAG TPA: CHAT domain-containing protein [Pyrinomonadaceae bacterium]
MKVAIANGDASKYLDAACSLWTNRGDAERAARARLQIGDIYHDDKRFEESLSQYHQILAIDGLSSSLKASTYDSIGQIYAELFQPELSQRNYSKALTFATTSKDYLVEAQVELDLGWLSFQKGDFDRAVEFAQFAVTASTKGNHQKELATALGFLGQAEVKSGHVEKGRGDLDRALLLFQQNNDQPGQVKTLCFLSGLNLTANQIPLAKAQADSALKIADGLRRSATTTPQRVRANALRWPCWLALARTQKASQEFEEARKSYFRAVGGTAVDWMMIYNSTERSAIEFAEVRQVAYREWVDLLVQLGKVDEAYNAYEASRAQRLAGLIHARHTGALVGDSETQKKTRALNDSIIAMRTRLLSPALNRQQRESLEQELLELEEDLTEKRLQAELAHPGQRLFFATPTDLQKLQSQLGENDLVLETCLGEDRSFVWLISHNTYSLEILPGRGNIEEKVRPYLSEISVAPSHLHLQSSINRQRAMGTELFKILVGKLATQLRPNTRLLIIPDGVLNQLPYESLVHDDHFLIEDVEVSYLPSAGLLDLLRQAEAKSVNGPYRMDLLAFGDPLFQKDWKASVRRKGTRASAATENVLADWDLSKLESLPRTRDEVEYIAKLLPTSRSHLYLGNESTEKAFKQEFLSNYKWIHLATHSLISERNPNRSAVILLPDSGGNEDGFLRATEITNLDLDCDLVTLSACETAHGQVSSGEGVIGLSRSFLVAGARSVLVSQWAVSDISTSQLMKDFYQRLVAKASKPAALREAKLRMIHSDSPTRHPYYWSPFVIIAAP